VHGAGRWSLVPALGEASALDEPDELAEALADQLLQRWGVVFYDLAAHEHLALPWRHLQWALRRLEDRGLVKGGRFVKGFSGEQFALPEAVDDLNRIRRSAPTGRTVTVCGADPLNLTGVVLPGPRVPARRTELVQVPI
jgi:ATP-dependent Lhr-like helicase